MVRSKVTAHERAQIAFGVYVQMRPRSLQRLHEQLVAVGVPISLATLKRYSRDYRWQEQLAGLEAEASHDRHQASVTQLLAMQDRHAQLARAVQGAGGSALEKLLRSDQRLATMRPGEIARLLELGLRTERSAVGESADRRDIATAVWNSVATEMVGLFKQINEETDAVARARLFARGVDRIVDQHLEALRHDGEDSHAH